MLEQMHRNTFNFTSVQLLLTMDGNKDFDWELHNLVLAASTSGSTIRAAFPT